MRVPTAADENRPIDGDDEFSLPKSAEQTKHFAKSAAEHAGKCKIAIDSMITIAQQDVALAAAVPKLAQLAKRAADLEVDLAKLRATP